MKATMLKRVMWVVALLVACCGTAWALGEEDFGNEPLNVANFKEWPEVMPVVNHPSRVYHQWVNGNEQCYYQGDVAALNDTLRKFAEVKTQARDVVLRPGPGQASSFDGKRKVPFSWHLQMYGGISKYVLGLEEGKKVWSDHPVLTVYTGGAIDLSKIEIPKGVTLLSVTEVKKRTREGLKSKDKTVRGWGAGVLASLDAYDAESREAVTALLSDPDSWVRLNAAHSLPTFGKAAQPALPLLRKTLETDDKDLKEAAPGSIQQIEQAQAAPDAERLHREQLTQIDRFVAQQKR
jgi:hypothetical protein